MNEAKQNEISLAQSLSQQEHQQQEQQQQQQPQQQQLPPPVSLHFGAIDPVQFDSSRLFEHISQSEHTFETQTSFPDAGQHAITPLTNNNVYISAPTQTVTAMQPPIEMFPHFSSFNQMNSNLIPMQHQAPSAPQPQSHLEKVYNDNMEAFREIQRHGAGDEMAFLEHRNQELGNLLHVEKVRNHELSVKVTQQHSTIEDMSKELEQLRKCANSIQDLQQQVNAHIQTVNVLVGEKSDLISKLQQRDQRIGDFESECVELQGRLKASRHRVSELEKDLNTLTQSHQKYDGSQQALCAELETLQDENKRLQRLHQEACDENTEIQHQLEQKTKEIGELKNVVLSKNSELEMARVRLEQLTGGDLTQSNDVQNTEQNQKDQRLLDSERQIIELQNMISEMTNDRDRTQQQYQTYVQHLTNETTTMTQRIQELTKANEKLSKREESLLNHVQELEKQIQKQLSTQRRIAALQEEEKLQTNEPSRDATVVGDTSHARDELRALQEKLNAIEKEKTDLNVRRNPIFNLIIISMF